MIYFYVGNMGSGKSYSAVSQAIKYLKKGKKVWVNFFMDIRETYPDLNPDNLMYFMDVDDLAYMRDGLMIVDEAHQLLNARKWQEFSSVTQGYITESRKLGVDIIFICQSFKFLESSIRDVSSEIVFHKKFLNMFFQHSCSRSDINAAGQISAKGVSFPSISFFNKKVASSYDSLQLFSKLYANLPDKVFPPSYEFYVDNESLRPR